MSWVAVAVVGGSILGGVIQGNAAQGAADTQAAAQMQAANIGKQEFNTITAQEQPFMQAGYGAQNQLNYLLGIGGPGGSGLPSGYGGSTDMMGAYGAAPGRQVGMGVGMNPEVAGPQGGQRQLQPTPGLGGGFGSLLDPFTIDRFHQLSPAYQFQLQQGAQGTLNGLNPSGSALSPAAQKELMSYNQNYANTAFNNAFQQYQQQQGNIYQRLSGIAQLGQAAAANTGQQGTALASNIGQSIASAGAAQAAGQIGAANAYAGGLSSLGGLYAAYGGGGGGGLTPSYASGIQGAAADQVLQNIGPVTAIGGGP